MIKTLWNEQHWEFTKFNFKIKFLKIIHSYYALGTKVIYILLEKNLDEIYEIKDYYF